MTIHLELDERKAELLHQALMLIIQASSIDLMKQYGWENADQILATTLIDNTFDSEDLDLLNSMATNLLSHLNYNTCCNFKEDVEDYSLINNNLNKNVVILDGFRKKP